jgi:hypothetical protein
VLTKRKLQTYYINSTIKVSLLFFKKTKQKENQKVMLGTVVHVYHPCYSEGGNLRGHSSKPAQAKKSVRPHLNNKLGMVEQIVAPDIQEAERRIVVQDYLWAKI